MQIGASSHLSLDAYRPTAFTGGRGSPSSSGKPSLDAGEAKSSTLPQELTPEEQRVVAELARVDREVRIHEQTHMAAGSGVVSGGPSYSYTTGPDGKRYAVGGEVSISTTPGRTPEETIAKAQQIRRAALAPAEPSAQDRQVASAASAMEAEAYRELAAQKSEQAAETTETATKTDKQVGSAVGLYQQMQSNSTDIPVLAIDAFA